MYVLLSQGIVNLEVVTTTKKNKTLLLTENDGLEVSLSVYDVEYA